MHGDPDSTPSRRPLVSRIARRVLPARWEELLGQLRYGWISERDIELFAHLDGLEGLVVDAGANRGQFALSLLAVNRSLRVLAFEPNRSLRWALLAIGLRHARRFRFRLRGLGETAGELELHEPEAPGVDLSSNASLDAGEFERELVRERLAGYSGRSGGRYGFRTRHVRLIALDSLKLSPLAIKIDVEGWEPQALSGMRETLTRCHPLLMIELNQPERFLPWLESLGYRFYGYNAETGRLSSDNPIEGRLNIFGLHPDGPPEVHARLQPWLEDD